MATILGLFTGMTFYLVSAKGREGRDGRMVTPPHHYRNCYTFHPLSSRSCDFWWASLEFAILSCITYLQNIFYTYLSLNYNIIIRYHGKNFHIT